MNLLALETLILARLRETITDVDVGSSASVAGAVDITKLVPLIFIQPADADSSETRGDGRASLDVQRWAIHVLTEAVPDKRFLDASYQGAGELLGRVFVALAGWSAGPGYGPMKYAGRPEPFLQLGWAAFPIVFECTVPLVNT